MDQTNATRGVLAGARVVDATAGVAGPLAAMLLADFGADVVKVEPPGGDPGRAHPGAAVWDRNKRAGVLDPDDPASVAAYEALVSGADVLVTNEPVAHVTGGRPRLVHLVMPAYLDGATWPHTLESEGLLAATTGVALRQSSSAGGPIDAVVPVLPTVHGIWAAAAAVAALVERETSGQGQTVTVSGLHGAMVAAAAAFSFDPTSTPSRPVGGPGGTIPFYRTYRGSDGEWLFLASLTPRFTAIAFEVLGVTDLYDDPRIGGRGRAGLIDPDNIGWVTERIAEVVAIDTRDAWLERLHAAGCPCGPVLSRDTWLDHPQVRAIDMRVEVDDPERGRVIMPGVPITLSESPGAVLRSAPPRPDGPADPWPDPPWAHGDATQQEPVADGRGGPLAGVRVLDLGAIIAGPFTASLLAELGAEVIKVEPPGGDSFRGPGFGAYNKGQRGVVLDLRDRDGYEAFLASARRADVVIDNYRPGVLSRLRLDRDSLIEVNPELISVSITGFGDGGPLGDEPGFDPVLQAMSGMMHAQGGDGEPGFFTVPVNDVTAASATALGALLALLHRIRTGTSQRVCTSLAAMATLQQAADLVRFDGRPAPRVGGADHRGASPLARYYEASDGWIRLLGELVGGREPSPVATAVRALDLDPLDAESIAAWVRERARHEAAAELCDAGVPAVVVRATEELVDDPVIVDHEVLRPDSRPGKGHCWTAGRHAEFSRTPVGRTSRAPDLGQHTAEVLAEAGHEMSTEEPLTR